MDVASTTPPPKDDTGFFSHVFNFDKTTKGELLNVIQYCLTAIIPLILVIHGTNFFFPKVDESKGSLELVAEALGQLCLTFIILLFLHRLLTYFSPWGDGEHASLNFSSMILTFLWVTLSYGLGHIGSKIDLVVKRSGLLPRDNFWDDNNIFSKIKKKAGSIVKRTQPLSQLPPPIATKQASQPTYITSQAQMTPPLLPAQQALTQFMPPLPVQGESMGEYNRGLDERAGQQTSGQYGDYNPMYAGGEPADSSQPWGTPGNETVREPMAANAALGGYTSF